MLYRTHPRISFQPSALGFGCMRLPIVGGDFGHIDEDKAVAMIRHAIDSGVNYLDTAWPYHRGTSEGLVAKALAGGYRERVKIADKLPVWEKIESWADADRIFEEQLRRLNTDHIDFYMLHGLGAYTWKKSQDLKLMQWAQQKKDAGQIGHLGFSFHDDLSVFKEIVDAWQWDFCQIQYNYMDTDYQAGTEGLRYAYQRGLAVIIMEPLRGGDLVRNLPPDVQALLGAAPVKRSPAEWSLRWLLSQKEVWLVLSGMNKMEDVDDNLAIASNAPVGCMSADDNELLRRAVELFRQRKPVGCTGCRYCMPCPQGIDIPEMLGMLNEWRMFENTDKMRFAVGWMRPTNHPDLCTACGQCMEKCPQHADIPALMAEFREVIHMLTRPQA